MNKIILLLFFPIISFSQINLCDRSVEISNLFYNENYKSFVDELKQLRKDVLVDENLVNIIDYNIATGLFILNDYVESKVILDRFLVLQNENFKFNLKCDKDIFIDDYQVPNVFESLSGRYFENNYLELYSDVCYNLNLFDEALFSIESLYKNKYGKSKFMGCGSHLRLEIINYERRKFNILRSLNKIEDSNISAMNILMLTLNEDLIIQVKNSLLKNHTKKEIKREFKKNLINYTRTSSKIAGIELNVLYFDFFEYKIALWDFRDDENLKSYFKDKLAYRILVN
jgi:hypothetical protein